MKALLTTQRNIERNKIFAPLFFIDYTPVYKLELFIRYLGLFFISRYIFSKYNPRIPRAVKIKLPRNKIMQVNDGQPATGSPKHIARTKTTINKITASRAKIKPMAEIIVNGHVE